MCYNAMNVMDVVSSYIKMEVLQVVIYIYKWGVKFL